MGDKTVEFWIRHGLSSLNQIHDYSNKAEVWADEVRLVLVKALKLLEETENE